MQYSDGVKKLVEVIQDLSSVHSLEQVMFLVRKAARAIANSDGATFVLRDGEFCFYADEDAIGPLWKGQRFPIQTCISGWAMLNKKAVVIEDIYQDSRIPIDAYAPTFVKSLAMTPIRKEAPIGAIGAYWKEKHIPTDEQLELLQALANSTSIALENLNLYQTLEGRIEELKMANKAKDEFLMTVSHELRTPLNAILGWTEILLDGPLDEEARMGLETIERNARHQSQIVAVLLDSSRIMSGKLQIKSRELELVQLVRNEIALLQPEAEAKNLKIEVHSSIEKAFILGDEERLKQVTFHLLNNAIKFSNKGGKILVDISSQGPAVQVRVRDEGEGIDPEFLPSIFEAFRQADSSSTRKYGGLGLGLSISRHLIEAHKGKIAVYSEGPGKGTTALFTIPLYKYAKVGIKNAEPLGK
ncbi:GAF domain-containing sensor histidine kinase [Bdellovibrio sp. BCCA]|uniref:GAF domain-containing sensor histidine kinase n=1 Tax=Bdellovibrio sp. BCCA TaxID=3136281 RepID=UPI0030F26BBB